MHQRLAALPWPTVVTAAVLAWFTAAVLLSARSSPLIFDVGLHAIVARNVATGYGWAMSYPGRELFVTISSGPTLIMPAALMTAVFGNRIWVPALSAALLHAVLMAVLVWRLQRLQPLDASRWRLPSAVLGLALLFLYFESMWWTWLIGEISAWLLFLIACTVAVDPGFRSERKRYFCLGLLASLSLLARMISLPAFAGLAAYLLWQQFRAMRQRPAAWRETAALAAFGLLGLIAAALPFRIYEITHFIGPETPTYLENLHYRIDAYKDLSGVGIGKLLQQADWLQAIAGNAATNYRVMAELLARYGLGAAGLPAMALISVLLLLASRFRTRHGLDALIAILALATLFYALWYFIFCQTTGFDRYALLPLLTGFCLLLLQITRHASWPGMAMVLLALLLSAPQPRLQLLKQTLLFQDIGWMNGHAQTYNREILQARDFLRDTPFPYPLANCGWMGSTRELEYLLPQPENFRNCFDLIEAALEPDPDAHDGRYRWREPVAFTLVINEIAWRMAGSHPPSASRHRILMQACAAPLYRNLLYRVMLCPADALQAHVPLDRETPFIGQREPLEQRPRVDARQRALIAAERPASAAGRGHQSASP